MQSGCSLILRKAWSQGYVSQLCVHPPQLIRSLPGVRVPKHRHQKRYSPCSSSSVSSSSSPSSSGTLTPVNQQQPQQQRRNLTTTMAIPDELQKILPALQQVVPVLAPGRHKGQAGKIAVIGGCREYTGAPYFAAISALKMGADLAHVFCTEGAATVIKSYSPELIVHPVLHESYDLGEIGEDEIGNLKAKVLEEVGKWLTRFDCIVVGPGLGRDSILLECVAGIIEEAKSKNIPLVIDGDGLFLVTNQPELVVGYPLAILTPNVMEHKRLVAKINQEAPENPKEISDDDLPGQLQALAKKFQEEKNAKEEPEEAPENAEDPETGEETENAEDPDKKVEETETAEEPEKVEEPEKGEDPENAENPENAEEPEHAEETENAEDGENVDDPDNPKETSDEKALPDQLQELANKFQTAKIVEDAFKDVPEEEIPDRLQALAKKMQGVTIVQKGKTDYISDGKAVLHSDYYGSPRRCGGQGDVLSGSTAVFVSWARAYFSNENAEGKKDVHDKISDNPTMVGALAGSLLVRKSAANAFAQHKRSTVTGNIIEDLGQSMDELFPM